MKAKVLINGIILSTFLSTACAKTDSEPEQPASENATAGSVEAEDAASPASAKKKKGAEFQFSQAMDIPVDGSSLEAFDKSLETIKSQAEKSEYETLTGAIDYLLVYDLGARRDRERLAKRLDGLTGKQIVDRVSWEKKPKKTN